MSRTARRSSTKTRAAQRARRHRYDATANNKRHRRRVHRANGSGKVAG